MTIATNMAGRGTDIKLGAGIVKESAASSAATWHSRCGATDSKEKCMADMPCSLRIIGTERHEARASTASCAAAPAAKAIRGPPSSSPSRTI